jgi:methionine aminopeptidase type I
MIILKSPPEIAVMRVAGSIVATVLEELRRMIRPGISLAELDKYAEATTRKYHAIPAFKGYNGFPASICASVNEEVVHGIPGKRVLKDGDIIGLDFGVIYRDFYGDSAITVPVGEISPMVRKLITVTEEALMKGISRARVGNRLYDISDAVQRHVEGNGFSVVCDFVGHGIGAGPEAAEEFMGVYVYLHDNFLEMLVCGGLIGLALYLRFFWRLYRDVLDGLIRRNVWAVAALASMAVYSLTSISYMRIYAVTPNTYFALAAGTSLGMLHVAPKTLDQAGAQHQQI